MKVAIYIRKSREDRDEYKEDTLLRHERLLKEYCDKYDLRYNEKSIYREIVSGDSINNRPQMQQLLKDVENNLYDGVVVGKRNQRRKEFKMKKIYLTNEKRNEMEKERGKASYSTLVDRYFENMILCNNLLENYFEEIIDNMELGSLYDEETGEYDEVYQTFIVDNLDQYDLESLRELEESNNDDSIILSYIPSLDLQVLLVTHYGTSWSYVNTNVELTEDLNEAIY